MYMLMLFSNLVLSLLGVLWIAERITVAHRPQLPPSIDEDEEADAAIALAEHGLTMEDADGYHRITTDTGVVLDIPNHVEVVYALPGDEVSAAPPR